MYPENITILTRPFSSRAFHFIAQVGLSGKNVSFTSDTRGVEAHWLMTPFYRAYRSSRATTDLVAPLGEAAVADIISRCRYLRTAAPDQARRMVGSMWEAANELIDERAPDLIISCHMDCYLYDVICRAQNQRGKDYLAIGDTLFPEYGEVNYRFLPLEIRTPAPEEVEDIL